jgi:CPA1 family monovalent cation:H+ antiporter
VALFESLLTLLLIAIVLLQVSRRLTIPYPTMLAGAGVVVAAVPWAPDISMDPHLAMALFIAPALLDAAYDFPLRALRQYWMPLLALAVIAVLLTTAAVAWVGVAYAGLPLAAAIALGAIVSPPDAAAAAAMFNRLALPRSTITVLKGESLLNDAVALLIFGVALALATNEQSITHLLPQLALAVPGGIVLGMLCGKIAIKIAPFLAGTLGSLLFQFVMTFCVWIIAERLHLSAILAVVAAAMTAARYGLYQPARDRIHSFAVWSASVFLLNVLAFLLVGLEARTIVIALDREHLQHALAVAGVVLATVVGVRIVWVLAYNRLAQPLYRWLGRPDPPTLAQGIVAAWCGMRGLVTLATALALPPAFPGRDVIVLSALTVVLGTLVVQGITMGPLIRWLRFAQDHDYTEQLASTRVLLLDAAITRFDGREEANAQSLLLHLQTERAHTLAGRVHHETELGQLRRESIATQRATLMDLWQSGAVDDEIFRSLQQELDLAELAASSAEGFALVDD